MSDKFCLITDGKAFYADTLEEAKKESLYGPLRDLKDEAKELRKKLEELEVKIDDAEMRIWKRVHNICDYEDWDARIRH